MIMRRGRYRSSTTDYQVHRPIPLKKFGQEQNNNMSMNHPSFTNNTTVQGVTKVTPEGLTKVVNTSLPLSVTTRGKPVRGYYYQNISSLVPHENNDYIDF